MSRIARHFNPAFVVAAAILILALPHIAANEYELRLITLLLIYAIIALGLNVLVGLTGLVSLGQAGLCLLYTSPSPRDGLLSRMPSSA